MKKVLLLIPVILFITVIALFYAISAENGESSALFVFTGGQQSGADSGNGQSEGENAINPYKAPAPGDFDSVDTAIVAKINTEDRLITFLNKVVNRYYTLSYDGLSSFYDKYGIALSAAQLKAGEIVDLTFRRGNKHLVSATVSPSSWSREISEGFNVNPKRKSISFGKDSFSLWDRMVLLSGKDEITLQDLNLNDTISISGIDNIVYSIRVDKGHGYLRLTGDEYFNGGYIEVGQRIFTKITGDMLLTVPEGTYKVSVRNGRHGGSKEATIYKDEETLLDVSDLQGEEIKTGNVFFTLNPQEASVYIDGDKVDTSTAVELEYGIHSMIVTATGYETISQYLRVGQPNANLNVSMERSNSYVKDDSTGNPGITQPAATPGEGLVTDENGNVVITEPTGNPEENQMYNSLPLQPDSGVQNNNQLYPPQPLHPTPNLQNSNGVLNNSNSQSSTGGDTTNLQNVIDQNPITDTPANDTNTITPSDGTYQVQISAPEGAEVYVDGSYVGIVPISFRKKAGSRVISLRKNGYQTRSYTVQVDNDPNNMQLSFSELEPSASQNRDLSNLTNALIGTLTGNSLNNALNSNSNSNSIPSKSLMNAILGN